MKNDGPRMNINNTIIDPGRTADGCDLEFLRGAMPPHALIVVPVGAGPKERDMQEAFARSILNGWIAPIDIGLAPDPRSPALPPLMQRVFQLTALGQARLAALRARRGTPVSTSSLMQIENWTAVKFDMNFRDAYYPTKGEAEAAAESHFYANATYCKVRVARRGRSLYLLTPIRRGPK